MSFHYPKISKRTCILLASVVSLLVVLSLIVAALNSPSRYALERAKEGTPQYDLKLCSMLSSRIQKLSALKAAMNYCWGCVDTIVQLRHLNMIMSIRRRFCQNVFVTFRLQRSISKVRLGSFIEWSIGTGHGNFTMSIMILPMEVIWGFGAVIL